MQKGWTASNSNAEDMIYLCEGRQGTMASEQRERGRRQCCHWPITLFRVRSVSYKRCIWPFARSSAQGRIEGREGGGKEGGRGRDNRFVTDGLIGRSAACALLPPHFRSLWATTVRTALWERRKSFKVLLQGAHYITAFEIESGGACLACKSPTIVPSLPFPTSRLLVFHLGTFTALLGYLCM